MTNDTENTKYVFNQELMKAFQLDAFPDGSVVMEIDADASQPYIEVADDTTLTVSHRYPLPEPIAYYLRARWCGSEKMASQLQEQGAGAIRRRIKGVLCI